MTYVLYGVFGALFTVLLFLAGIFTGWRLHIKYLKMTETVVREELSEEQKRRQKEEAQAFDHLVNYSPDLAYGVVHADDLYSDKE